MMGIHVFILHLCSIPTPIPYSFPLSLLCLRVRDRKRVSAVLCRNLALLCNVEGNQGNGRPPNRCQTTLSNTKQQEGQLRTRDFSQNNTHRDGKKERGKIRSNRESGKYSRKEYRAEFGTAHCIRFVQSAKQIGDGDIIDYCTIFVCKSYFTDCLRLKAPVTTGQCLE